MTDKRLAQPYAASCGAAAVQFAVLQNKPKNVTAADFFVVA